MERNGRTEVARVTAVDDAGRRWSATTEEPPANASIDSVECKDSGGVDTPHVPQVSSTSLSISQVRRNGVISRPWLAPKSARRPSPNRGAESDRARG